jgi:hypothetical protein
MSKCCKKITNGNQVNQLFTINIPDATWQFGGRGRHRERERAAERRGETGLGWRVESVRESRETQRERAAKRVKRQGEAGEWTVESVGETETERAAE